MSIVILRQCYNTWFLFISLTQFSVSFFFHHQFARSAPKISMRKKNRRKITIECGMMSRNTCKAKSICPGCASVFFCLPSFCEAIWVVRETKYYHTLEEKKSRNMVWHVRGWEISDRYKKITHVLFCRTSRKIKKKSHTHVIIHFN